MTAPSTETPSAPRAFSKIEACGFVRPQSGTVTFDGHPLTGTRAHRLAGLEGLGRVLGQAAEQLPVGGGTAGEPVAQGL